MFNINGILVRHEPLWRHCSFAIGGPADFYAVPRDEDDLKNLLLGAADSGIPYFILGGGSNILMADKGFRGLVIDTRSFNDYQVQEQTLILGAGMPVSDAAWFSGASGLAGLDFLFGMPGSVGGAIWMNARCYDEEIADKLLWVDLMYPDGRISRIPMKKSEWAYKLSPFQSLNGTILRAGFAVTRGEQAELKASMREKRNDREAKGHYKKPCAGSAFKNNRAFGAPSGLLIDRCGLKGTRIGGARVSDWHGNIIINDQGAAASDVRKLLIMVRARVEEDTGFLLEEEVLPVGDWSEGD